MSTRVDPDRYLPHLGRRSYLWRLALCCVISFSSAINTWENLNHMLLLISIVAGTASYILIFYRRRWPFKIALILVLLSVVSPLASGPAIWGAVSFAARRQIRQIIILGLVALASMLAALAIQPTAHPVIAVQTYDSDVAPVTPTIPSPPMLPSTPGSATPLTPTTPTVGHTEYEGVLTALGSAVLIGFILGIGMYIGSRRELFWTLSERARSAEEERDLRDAAARIAERSQIAREMHDVLAHRISRISMQAGAMIFREDLTTNDLRSQAQVIQEQSHAALNELREILGALRSDEYAPASTPYPTFSDIDSLITDSRATGMRIEYEDAVDSAESLPEGLGRTAYRIVQESLTNVQKHAPDARVSVRIAGSPGEGLSLRITNPVGFASRTVPPGSSLGLVGLGERVAQHSGQFTHGIEGSSFIVRAQLPWAI